MKSKILSVVLSAAMLLYTQTSPTFAVNTPLHDLLKIGNSPAIIADAKKILSCHPEYINEPDDFGAYALHYAVLRDQPDIAQLLLDNGANVDCEISGSVNIFSGGKTPLDWAIHSGNLKITQVLINNSANVNRKGPYGITPLHEAIQSNHFEIAELLINNGANVNIKNIHGETPLYNAVENDRFELSQLLIDHHAEINCQNNIGRSPLHEAVFRGHTNIVRLLLDNGANVYLKDKRLDTPLDLADNNHPDIVRMLLDHGAKDVFGLFTH